MEQLIGHQISFEGADGQRHYAGVAIKIESGYPDGAVRLVCTGRPGYDRPGEVCRLSLADRPMAMPRGY